MAAAEARAVWQRAANRCFVQEDAKRAPKLACCQSSSSSSSSSQSKPVDDGPATGGAADDMPDHHRAAGFGPRNRNPSYSNLSPDTRWWLQLQPNYGYQKGQLADFAKSPSKTSEGHPLGVRDGSSVDAYECSDVHCAKKDMDVTMQNRKVSEVEDVKEMAKLVEMDPIGILKSHTSNDYGFDAESPWIGSEKNVPWWRTTDKDDLAFLVAQKSLDYMENCDLPPPRKMQVRRYQSAPAASSDIDDTPVASMGLRAQSDSVSSPTVCLRSGLNSDSAQSRQQSSIDGHSHGSDKPFSCTTTHMDCAQTGQVSESDTCKAQLLEALRHSQTRAREAEKVAKQVCAEKEHIVKLFFRQASQLFAYKQWFQLLQLETLYHQVKNRDQPMSELFPVALPWMPHKGKKLRKNLPKTSKGKRGKRGRPRPDVSKYAVAFALGLSLVGAGLLLGWTVGWMFPF